MEKEKNVIFEAFARKAALKQHYKITEMFTGSERTFIVNKVLELSGMTGDAKIEVIREDEEIKNS